MRQGAVGQKCPACARQPRSARARGKPQHYVRLAVTAPAAAVAAGLLYAVVLSSVRFGSIILAAIVGFAMGRVVAWAARGQTQQPFSGVAVGTGIAAIAVGLLFAGASIIPTSLFTVLAYAASGWFALRGLQR